MIVPVANVREGDTVRSKGGSVATISELVPMIGADCDDQLGFVAYLILEDGGTELSQFWFGNVFDRIAAA